MKKTFFYILFFYILCSYTIADDFSFDELFSEEQEITENLDIHGVVRIPYRFSGYNFTEADNWNTENVEDGVCSISPELHLDLSLSLEDIDFKTSLNINREGLEDNLFNELCITYYKSIINLTLGLQKIVWGKGDDIHVLDLLNPIDYSDFINKKYLDRKIAEPMIDFKITHSFNGKLELVYIPFYTPDTIATEGSWVLSDTKQLLQFNNVVFPETQTLKYSQFGARLTGTFAMIDLGLVYYLGRDKTPVITDMTVETLYMEYDPLQVIGLELGTVLYGFNIKAEGAYNLTDDLDGTDKTIYNPSLSYVVGADHDIPLHNVNINIQLAGERLLFDNNISDMDDVEYSVDTNVNTFICSITDSFDHEKIKTTILFIHRLYEEAYFIKPEVEYNVNGNLTFEFSLSLYEGKDDTFIGQFNNNDFISLTASYMF